MVKMKKAPAASIARACPRWVCISLLRSITAPARSGTFFQQVPEDRDLVRLPDVDRELGGGGAVVPDPGRRHQGRARHSRRRAPPCRRCAGAFACRAAAPAPGPRTTRAARRRTVPGHSRPGRGPRVVASGRRGFPSLSGGAPSRISRSCGAVAAHSAASRPARRPRPCPRSAAARAGTPAGRRGPAARGNRPPCAGTRAALRSLHHPQQKALIRVPAPLAAGAAPAGSGGSPGPRPARHVPPASPSGSRDGSTSSGSGAGSTSGTAGTSGMRRTAALPGPDTARHGHGHGRLEHAGFLRLDTVICRRRTSFPRGTRIPERHALLPGRAHAVTPTRHQATPAVNRRTRHPLLTSSHLYTLRRS